MDKTVYFIFIFTLRDSIKINNEDTYSSYILYMLSFSVTTMYFITNT